MSLVLVLVAVAMVAAQTPLGTEAHPALTTYRCTVHGGCSPASNFVVLDSLAHWVHQVNSTVGCGDWGDGPNATACPTAEACARNCVQEGLEDYATQGVSTQGSALRMQMIVGRDAVSPRVYLLDESRSEYEMTHLTGGEVAFDVDVAKLPCGMNSALFLSEMEADGGRSDLNRGGAWRGTGYCDAQCYTTPFINGEANIDGLGACCNEMDIWEANSRATHLAPHPCSEPGVYRCSGDACSAGGVCDKAGCGWNPQRNGHGSYYGRGRNFTVDTTRPFSVVTQFPSSSSTGRLAEMRRLYLQDGRLIHARTVAIEGVPDVTALRDDFCRATGAKAFARLGGVATMGDAMTRGMVLVFALWWDAGGNMTWLDGAAAGAGPCNATEGNPDAVVRVERFPEVTFSNVRWGEIGSTLAFAANSTANRTSPTPRPWHGPRLR